jgi:hypothetical protein
VIKLPTYKMKRRPSAGFVTLFVLVMTFGAAATGWGIFVDAVKAAFL